MLWADIFISHTESRRLNCQANERNNVLQTKTKQNLLWYSNESTQTPSAKRESLAHIWPNLCCICQCSILCLPFYVFILSNFYDSHFWRHSEIESINLNQILYDKKKVEKHLRKNINNKRRKRTNLNHAKTIGKHDKTERTKHQTHKIT